MKITTFSEYSKRAAETQMESCKNEDYLRLGLISEVGELAAIFKRAIRGDFKLEDKREDILLELGDVCWYLDRLQTQLGWTPNGDEYAVRIKSSDISWLWELQKSDSFSYRWHCVIEIAYNHGFTIWDVLTANVEKLAKRKAQGKIMGSGDHREEQSNKEPDAPYCGCAD